MMFTLNEETQKLQDPATPVAHSSPDTIKLSVSVSNNLDLKASTKEVAKLFPSTVNRFPASQDAFTQTLDRRQLWCYSPNHPRLRLQSKNLTLKTLKKNEQKYSKEIWKYYNKNQQHLTEYKVKGSDTLFNLSRKIVGKEDIWIEIYLLNRDKIPDWNNLESGIKLKIPKSSVLPVKCSSFVALK